MSQVQPSINNNQLTTSAHKTKGINRTQTMRYNLSSFTGKEKDEETGYGYFGARYMDHELMTMWLSVDPMADKYRSISPYAYCAWNPVKLVDPDGKEFDSLSAILVQKVVDYTKGQIEKMEKNPEINEANNKKLAEFNKALEEIELLKKDKSTIYKIHTNTTFSDQGTGGYTTYGGNWGDKNVIDIYLCNDLSSRKGLFHMTHELKHAFQFYDGDIIFAIDKSTGMSYMNNSRPLEDETYARSEAYGGRSIDPSDPYIMSLPKERVSIEQMQQKYPNHDFVFRKNK